MVTDREADLVDGIVRHQQAPSKGLDVLRPFLQNLTVLGLKTFLSGSELLSHFFEVEAMMIDRLNSFFYFTSYLYCYVHSR